MENQRTVDVNLINPFLSTVMHVLRTMAQVNPIPGRPFLKEQGATAKGDVTGYIGLAGTSARGSMAISFDEETLLFITTRIFGERPTELNREVLDVVGEITNIVTGGGKQALSKYGYKFEMAIPSVIQGKNHAIYHSTPGPIIVVPFTFEEEEDRRFFIEICMEKL